MKKVFFHKRTITTFLFSPRSEILHIGGVLRFPRVGVDVAGTILHCILIVTE